MLEYNPTINKEINKDELTVKEISPTMKINLRGKKRDFFTNIGKNLNMILPTEANTSTASGQLTAIWLSPDEWLVVSNEIVSKKTNGYDLNKLLFENISKKT